MMKFVLFLLAFAFLLSIIACTVAEQDPETTPSETSVSATADANVTQPIQQNPDAFLNLEAEETVTAPEDAISRILVEPEEQVLVGYTVLETDNLFLEVANLQRLQLPLLLEVMVSRNGETILQFGDEIKLTHPLRTDLFWVDREGDITEQVKDYFAGNAVIAMSDDGFTAIAGGLFNEPDTLVLALFSPTGEKLWEVPLDRDQRIDKSLVAPEGKYVVSLVTNRDDWLSDHQLQIRQISSELRDIVSVNGIVQKLVLVGDGDKVFVQGHRGYGLVDLETAKLLWWQDGQIRMISPSAASLSPGEETLFLVLADLQGQAEATYRWELIMLDAVSGSELARDSIPEEYPSTWEQVFEQVTQDQISILAGENRYTYSWGDGS